MKNCIQCGAAADDGAETCPACQRRFSYVAPAGDAPRTAPAAMVMRKRPDGTWLIALGWGGLALGFLFFILALAKSSAGFADDPYSLEIGETLGAGAGAFSQLGLLLLLAGLLIRAIWFLPGPDRKAPDDREPPRSG